MSDCTSEIVAKTQHAYRNKKALNIQGGSSKLFYGRAIEAESLSTIQHTGITEYEPSELYLSARCGTSLQEIEETIKSENQIIPFEPPHFGKAATLGGMIACGLSGPRRATAGSVRDGLLGIELINGRGEYLHFGGRVMKNVAGYDVSRLMCGALGTLGVIMSATIKLLPKPVHDSTLVLSHDGRTATAKMNQWANTPLPITATFQHNNELLLRLSGSMSAIIAAKNKIGGELLEDGSDVWSQIKEHDHSFFNTELPLWRISVPPHTPKLNLSGDYAMEWNGALRWYKTNEDEKMIRQIVEKAGGHACLFKNKTTDAVFHPLPAPLMKMHKNLKYVFDPENILNPGKMFNDI